MARESWTASMEGLGRLAGGVAHDFNNLVAVILNYAAFVVEDIAAVVGKTTMDSDLRWAPALRDIAEIDRAARRAALLTRQLLCFARREVIQPRVVRLNDIVDGLAEPIRTALGPATHYVADRRAEPSTVMADPGQVERLLLDLVANAGEAMPDGGTLTVATDTVVADRAFARRWPAVPPGTYVRLRVTDTGLGMTEEVARHAFEPYFSTRTDAASGGLGLSTVYAVVAQADGHVRLDSEVGLGTTVTVVLPVTAEPVAPAQPTPPAGPTWGRTVLVVDDEEALREVARRMFARNGYRVLVAVDGAEAVALATTHDGPIDLLVTDVVMPHMAGREVAEAVSAVRPGIAVLYVSGYAEPVLASDGRLDPGVTLLGKPFTEAELMAKVGEILAGNVAAR
jgi:CheY-like chemotaxis protein